MSSLFRRKLDELEDMFIASENDLLARFSETYEENKRLKEELSKYRNDVTASVDNLLDERTILKSEVERMTKELDDSMVSCFTAELEAQNKTVVESENAQLKEEVEFLKKQYAEAVSQFRPLREEIERLTKAGDTLVLFIGDYPNWRAVVRGWESAKKGKGNS